MAQPAEVIQFPGRPDGDQTPSPSSTARSIQVEDGYVRTATALVDAFCRAPLTSREARVIRVIERMTYGWNKAEDWIAASVISEKTGMPEGKCSETLNALIRKRVVTRSGGGRSPVRINKEVSEWDFSAHKSRATPNRKANPTCSESPQDGVSQSPQDGVTPIDITDNLEPKGSKNSSEKTDSPKHRYDDIDMELAKHMATHVDAITEKTGKHNLKSWANTIRLMRERDGFTGAQIRWLMDWVHADEFWQTNVLSPAKLREKQTQLIAKAKRQHKPARTDGRKGFAQPQAAGTYDTSSNDSLPDWAKGFEQ